MGVYVVFYLEMSKLIRTFIKNTDKLSFNINFNKMAKKYIINGKEVEAPWKFSLSVVIQRTPSERLIELQQLYNSMEYEQDTNKTEWNVIVTWMKLMKL